jgi:hypothetical protein
MQRCRGAQQQRMFALQPSCRVLTINIAEMAIYENKDGVKPWGNRFAAEIRKWAGKDGSWGKHRS